MTFILDGNMELWQVYHPHKYTVELNWMVLVIDGDFIQETKMGELYEKKITVQLFDY